MDLWSTLTYECGAKAHLEVHVVCAFPQVDGAAPHDHIPIWRFKLVGRSVEEAKVVPNVRVTLLHQQLAVVIPC